MKLIFKILLWILVVLLSLGLIIIVTNLIPVAPHFNKETAFWRGSERTLNIPHGGAKLLYPENTKYSFDKTSTYKVFEIDLSMTKDEVLISHHDTNLWQSLNHETASNPKPSKDDMDPNLDIINLTYDEVKQKIRDTDFEYTRNFVPANTGTADFANLTDAEYEEFLPTTLDYMFTNYSDCLYILEIKDTVENSGEEAFGKASKLLSELIKDYEMEKNVVVASFDDNVMKEFRKIDNTIPTAVAWNETLRFVVQSALFVDFFYFPSAEVASIPQYQSLKKDSSTGKLLGSIPGFIRDRICEDLNENEYMVNLGTKRIVDDLHRLGIATVYWTVNDKEDMKILLELGVDGIITDRPDYLDEVMAEFYAE